MEIQTYLSDWTDEHVAHVVDYEGEGPTGYGETPVAALADLVARLTEGGDPALSDALRALGGATAQGREDWLLAFEYLAGLLDVG